LANALTTALPDAVSEEDVRLVTESDSEDDPLGGVTIGLRRAGLISRLTEQSDGVQTLSTLALLSMAHRQSNIVGIDEPETHLHPTACRAVGSLLRRQTGQRVIATHSSHLASQFAPLELVALGPDRVARQITPAVPAAQAKFIARWWDSSLIEPLTARKVAVVEGAADRVLVQGAAAATNTPLDQMDVAVVELGGAGNFNTVYRFLGPDGFGVPLFGLCDEDHRSAWAAAIGVADQGLEAEGFRVANPDLEAEYVSSLGVPRVFELLVGSALFTDAEILQSCQVTDVAAISAGGLIEFCRAKKVMAAAGVASQLTAADVAALGPVQSLLADLR
jgi:putative ATP-dependent endonuclease of the OLD family